MSWTDERVEQLSKLWLEGRSASQIAAELGLGVTRNAVIGKVHRLGLAGRAKVVAPQAQGRTKAKAQVTAAPEVEEVEATVVPLRNVPTPIQDAVGELAIPPSERVTIMELRETSCRWPMGDPSHAEFRFCGAKTAIGSGPYCATHARLAFQPTQDRRRDRVERYARIA
ncbi:GcrA family cell cycle regulator [Lichenifustis flavocetrariae]|uniref:GcrA cell cycle regulator n=1 Tax=Lichenifustis flavocetrariae TaxID=2949735 RepID=A0AA42CKY9_9HYPH|nr:GcrA family cell cycle regulator [Lichenifustis flavocetrariae]MCW6511043.1 GcrA cell cycle regulator [Lichenifustis flavocetrariae]